MQNPQYRVVTNGKEFTIQKRYLRGLFRKKEIWKNIEIGFYGDQPEVAYDDSDDYYYYDRVWKYGTLEEAKEICDKLNEIWQSELTSETLKRERLNSTWLPV